MRPYAIAALGPRIRRARYVHPMLAKLVDKPFDRADWIFEVKWDGYRAIAEIDHGKVALYSRNGLGFEAAFKPIMKALQKIKHRAILDGEVVVVDEQGRSNFQSLQNFITTQRGALAYYVFDLLELDGENLRGEPLVERKRRLSKLIGRRSKTIRMSEHMEGTGRAMFRAAKEHGLEGIIAKRADSLYREGQRDGTWLKIKVTHRQEAIICGFTAPTGSRAAFGSLVLGVFEGKRLEYVGNVGTGFTDRMLYDLKARMDPLVVPTCPFATRPKMLGRPTWIEPKLVCEVAFTEWTGDGSMRHPSFQGMREDKDASEVRRER